MLPFLENLAVVLLSVGVVLCVACYLNRKLEASARRRANGVNGWQLSIIGSIYAVVLGFMLSDAWLAYQTAIGDVRNEAVAALIVYRTSALLPPACEVELQNATQTYIQTVIDVEWPAMERHSGAYPGGTVVDTMWNIANHCNARNMEPAHESVFRALESLQTSRDSRIEDANGHLPVIMWNVLIFGAVIVIGSSCLLGNEKHSVHCFHVASLTILIAVTLLAVLDLDRPFDGATRIAPVAFHVVQRDISRQTAR
jgi:hypothetical protein